MSDTAFTLSRRWQIYLTSIHIEESQIYMSILLDGEMSAVRRGPPKKGGPRDSKNDVKENTRPVSHLAASNGGGA